MVQKKTPKKTQKKIPGKNGGWITPWPKGQSGNPKGKPRGRTIKGALGILLGNDGKIKLPKKYLVDQDDKTITIKIPTVDAISMNLLAICLSKNPMAAIKAIETVTRYTEGDPSQIEISGNKEVIHNELAELYKNSLKKNK